MKNYLFHVGIDISKLKLDVNLLNSHTLHSEHFVIENTQKAIIEFVKILKRKNRFRQITFLLRKHWCLYQSFKLSIKYNVVRFMDCSCYRN